MRRGPKPATTAQKKASGTRKDRINEHEPKAPQAAPRPPAWLTPEALAEWNLLAPDLHAMGVLSVVDSMLFASYCSAAARIRKAEEALATENLTTTTERGVRTNPLVRMIQNDVMLVLRLGAEFGIGASSRSRISIKPPHADVDELDAFLRS